MGKTKIIIDYEKCGEYGKIDPRDCVKCLRACDPAVFLLHKKLGIKEEDPQDPQHWRITAVWLSICTRCFKCIEICPEQAIEIKW